MRIFTNKNELHELKNTHIYPCTYEAEKVVDLSFEVAASLPCVRKVTPRNDMSEN